MHESHLTNDHENDGSIQYRGWQLRICKTIDSTALSTMFSEIDRHQKARIRSCGGENYARWLTSCPTSENLHINNFIFQCLLRRRLGLPLNNLDCDTCNGRTCPVTLDFFGHHSSTCICSGRGHMYIYTTFGLFATLETNIRGSRLQDSC